MSHARDTWFDTKSAQTEGMVQVSIHPIVRFIMAITCKWTDFAFLLVIWYFMPLSFDVNWYWPIQSTQSTSQGLLSASLGGSSFYSLLFF